MLRFALSIAMALPLLAKAPLGEVQTVVSERIDAAPGGAVRVIGTTGELDVEGWDRPEVEVTVTKSTWRRNSPESVEAARRMLNRFRAKLERSQAGDILITAAYPSWNPITRPLRDRTAVSLQYVIKVPHRAHLVIRHESGDLRMEGLTGVIEASVLTGDIEWRVAEANPYAIDAKCRIGGVYSDFDGDHRAREVVGERFGHHADSSAQKAELRVGLGGIQILKVPAIAAAPALP